MTDTLAIVLGGGQGSRLYPLTATRSKPAVPIGGKYRLIDIPVSGCLHANIRRIFVLTQFNSASLNRHISGTYRLDSFSDGFVEILAAEQTPDNPHWFQGTADAVRKAAHDKARMQDPAVQRERRKVAYVPDEGLAPLLPARVAVVEVTLADGTELVERVEAVRGTVRNPMPRSEVVDKAMDLMGPVLGSAVARTLVQRVLALEAIHDIRTLHPLLRPA